MRILATLALLTTLGLAPNASADDGAPKGDDDSASRVEILHLGRGSQIRGVVVKETADKVFVDLQWTVLGVPKADVLRRETVSDEEAAPRETGSRQNEQALYYCATGLRERPVRDVVEDVADAVVRISTPNKSGSGFIISPDGYVLTNDHVIQSERRITITLYEQSKGTVEKRKVEDVHVIALNGYADLALLKIEGEKDLPYVHLALGEGACVGHTAFAIGNPMGLERTVSEGIVSTLNRAFDGLTYVQTTVQINPGNSGGPLFNLKGEVIGVTNMGILFAEGLNFAIPVERVRWFLANREAFAFDKDHPNTGYRYLPPPRKSASDVAGAAPAGTQPVEGEAPRGGEASEEAEPEPSSGAAAR